MVRGSYHPLLEWRDGIFAKASNCCFLNLTPLSLTEVILTTSIPALTFNATTTSKMNDLLILPSRHPEESTGQLWLVVSWWIMLTEKQVIRTAKRQNYSVRRVPLCICRFLLGCSAVTLYSWHIFRSEPFRKVCNNKKINTIYRTFLSNGRSR